MKSNYKKNKSKKRILLIYDDHCHIISNNIKILSNNYDISSYCSYLYKNSLSSDLKNNIKFFKYHEGFIYLFLIFKSFKYNYIFITTGPQNYNRSTGLIYLFFYLIFILVHGKKTMMGIRDNTKYFRGINKNPIDKIQNFIRNKSISRIKTHMNNFKKKFDKKKLNCFVNYPIRFFKNPKKKNKSDSNILRIGVLGMMIDKKKDYNMLINAIKKINEKQKKKIKLIILGTIGTVDKAKQNNILNRLQKHVNVEYQIGYILQSKLDKLCSSCHILISPLKYGFGGSHKGTGSFFDAIATKKILIIPFHADPQFEFKNFCYYYKDVDSLYLLIENFLKREIKPLGDSIFKLYENSKLRKELKKISLE